MMKWEPLEFHALEQRIEEIKHLLAQAAAVGAAQDAAMLERLTELQKGRQEVPRGPRPRR